VPAEINYLENNVHSWLLYTDKKKSKHKKERCLGVLLVNNVMLMLMG